MVKGDWKQINETAIAWYYATGADRFVYAEELFLAVYQIYEIDCDTVDQNHYTEVMRAFISEFYAYDMSKFDPKRSTFEHYFRYKAGKRIVKTGSSGAIRELSSDLDITRVERSKLPTDDPRYPTDKNNPDQNKKVLFNKSGISIYNSEDGSVNESILPQSCSFTSIIEARALLEKFMLSFTAFCAKKALSPSTAYLAEVFFTQDVSELIRTIDVEWVVYMKQREIWNQLQVLFLHFMLTPDCYSLKEVHYARQRLHGELVAGKAMKELKDAVDKIPLDVFTTFYLKIEGRSVSEATVSDSRKKYMAMRRECICEC